MKCAVLVSSKMSAIPIVECSGVILQPGDRLLVPCEKVGELKKHYGSILIHASDVEVMKLKQGTYELMPSGGGKAVVQAAEHIGEEVPSMADVSSDKSMQAKSSRVRRK